ncbi:vacuolar protein-sorting-associated protein 36-like [Amphibalanus amphitrite]|uniref:vacuolar protein-sorting-associated protein 36-like n=1 Tax=Amphibalanus amphitrite TaxID=1232801 RepID=UPI001C906640|nr:vacuolar protein-sorting-associated protein 36-like [Amphibalanus amphitrite]XP_043216266.1 vacuolar protein-sorting-associated protein 36-like [Amphibalanus amphitrite]XP_043216267.1 vacuolar protein-sorting-associated protein 36-like [Amphibalanus amphitrite]XP_043216268.1 vacuolar protein-sorting-associated protein 36-like [Amphibalanus amphitrite]
MDRFEWSDGTLLFAETEVYQQKNIQLYDGDNKTDFEGGHLTLTTHRLLWRNANGSCLALPLKYIVLAEKEDHTFFHSDKIVAHLSAPAPGRPAGPVNRSSHSHIKLSFRSGGMHEMFSRLKETMSREEWVKTGSLSAGTSGDKRGYRAGIVGIEKKLVAEQQQQNRSISEAFRDLTNLMEAAREMVALSRQISAKITEKQGGISEDETVRFQSQLLSLGVDDPVTRGTHGSGDRYHAELARQLATMLEAPARQAGGMLTLTDAYCRVNRARGLELISPEDLLSAGRQMTRLALPLRLHELPSGVRLLQLAELDQDAVAESTRRLLAQRGTLTAQQLAALAGVSVLLAKQRLLYLETKGGACRDESIQGLVFYPNRFLEEAQAD